MKQKGQNFKRKASRFSVDVAASSFLAFFFSFFFVYAQTSDLATAAPEATTSTNSTAVHGAHIVAPHHSPLHLPVGALPIPESESKTEKEASDSIDDEAGKLFATLLLSERSDLSSRKSLLLQLLSARQNRKEVSLFILHHSWKSYLS